MGRDDELTAIDAFLDGDEDGLVLIGDAGLGKTALWETVVDEAVERAARVLVATPGEGEERYSFAVLTDLLRDIDFDDLGLAAPQRQALDSALLRVPGVEPVEPQAVAVAVHAALEGLSRGRQLVVCIDDVQWADGASVEALLYAVRRLADRRVQIALTRRAGFARTPLEALLVRRQVRTVEPRPLTVGETAHLLVESLGLVVAPRVARLVHDRSQGNPLHALEIGRVLLARGIPELGEPLDIPEELAAVLGVRVRDLPEEQQTLLLALAVDPHVSEPLLAGLVGADAVRAALQDGQVTIAAGGRVRPRHPLLAAVSREAASPGRLQDLHLRLAELATTDEARARHLGLASPNPDEDLADRLDAASRSALDRGATQEAAQLADLALERSPADSTARPARVVALAERLAAAGESTRLSGRIEPEIERLPVGPERGRALLTLLDGIIGNMANAERWLDRAIEECDGDADVQAMALQIKASVALGIRVSGVAAAQAMAERAAALGTEQGAGRDWFLLHSGLPPETDAARPAAKWHFWRGEVSAAEELMRTNLAAADDEARLRDLVEARVGLSEIVLRTGRIAEARDLLRALDDSLMTDKESRDEDLLRAAIAVAEGDPTTARHWGRLTADWARDFGHGWIELESLRLLGVAARLAGEPEDAVVHLQRAWDWVTGAGVENPNIFPLAPELVEALVALDRFDDARQVLLWLEERAVAQDHPWGLATADRCRALIGLAAGDLAPDEAALLMRRAADRFSELGLLPDEARACLAVGSAQRRTRQWGLAREALERAGSIFATMGADGWVDLVTAELAKVGGRQPRASSELTPAEHSTASLAAAGLSNKEIARRTGVAIGTVEAHLSRAYLKLGVRSRSQLSGVLQAAPVDPPGE